MTKWGQFAVDYEERINFERLRKDRLNRIREAMKKDGIAAMINFKQENIRYVTGAVPYECGFLSGTFADKLWDHSILIEGSEPLLYVHFNEIYRVKETVTWMPGRIFLMDRPLEHGGAVVGKAVEANARVWAENLKKILKEHGVDKEKIGIDMVNINVLNALREAGLKVVDGLPTMFDARIIKTRDEIELMKIANSICEAAFETARRVLRPGIRECEVFGEVAKTVYSLGAERVEGIYTSGTRTKPYYRVFSDRIIRPGDHYISDVVLCYMGYHTCVVRTMLVGTRKATPLQKEQFKECYDSLYAAINAVKPGNTTKDVAEKLPEVKDYAEISLNIGHGIGLRTHEPPTIYRLSPELAEQRPEEVKPVKLVPNMCLAIETYSWGKPESKQGVRLEENLVVTETGYELLSKYPFDEAFM